MAIIEELQELRTLRIRQRDLAQWLHVTQQTVSEWYRGKRPVPVDHRDDLLRLAATARALAAEGREPQEAFKRVKLRNLVSPVGTSETASMIVPSDLVPAIWEASRRNDFTAHSKLMFAAQWRQILKLQPSADADPTTLCLTPEYLDEVMNAAQGLLLSCRGLLRKYLHMPDRKADF